jgi:uncharacterized membrane protein YoaK (UPF0700 family)
VHRYDRPLILIAIASAALAGFVDAIAFSSMGFFASFMSGNTTRLGVALGAGIAADARIAGALVLAFVTGVIVAAIAGRIFAARRKAAVMGIVTALILLAALLAGRIADRFVLLLLAAAMGAENGVFSRDGEVSIGLTYMTGTLVRIGQRLAGALMGDADRWSWAPYLLLWAGFLAGVIAGGYDYALRGFAALWIAGGAAAGLTVLLGAVGPAGSKAG